MTDNDKTVGVRRRNSGDGSTDTHATGRADRHSNSTDTHATGRADRNTAQSDSHATGRADRGASDSASQSGAPRPFEQNTGGNRLRSDIVRQVEQSDSKSWPDEFQLDGVTYRNEGILSDSSGEAIVFTVSHGNRRFALKIYYYDPDHRPNHRILEKIRSLSDSGLLVNIVSHGQWTNPNDSGPALDYELMDYCEGGSLDGVVLAGNEQALAEVAVRMASAIDFLAKHGILHRDIKPANFFYADKERTRVVLADFGISAECPEGGYVRIDEMRSPVYAAPEFYTNVPGEPAEVGVESDFFSLGVSLLCLWMGKDRFTADERGLLRDKLREKLPVPTDMSPRMADLIKSLTRLKMTDRATFDDIRRWARGESLSPVADRTHSDFRIVFNSARNLIAHSPEQLAQLLLDDKALGKKYLYSGRVVSWLEAVEYNELAVNIEDIVKKLYPRNEDAGLMSTVYLLNPAADYVAPDGTHMSNPAEIARHVFINSNTMGDEVLNPDSNLMIYLRALKLDKTVKALREYADSKALREGSLPAFKASFYLNVLLNKEAPLPVSTGDSDWEMVYDIDRLVEVLHRDKYINLINTELIESPGFIVWLSYRRPELAGKVRMLHDSVSDDEDSEYFRSNTAYRIIYEIAPEAGVFFSTDPDDPDRVYDIRQIGHYLNQRLTNMSLGRETFKDFMGLFDYMNENAFGDYLRARGEAYRTFLGWNRYCMDCDSEENRSKAGPYDIVIGAYRSVAGFLQGAPTYTLDGREITEPDQLKQFAPETVAKAMGGEVRYMPSGNDNPVAWLDAWLTVFYQENPALDLSDTFTYEKQTARYTEFIGSLVPEDYYFKRYRKALRKIDRAAGRLRKSERKVNLKRNIILVAGLLPTLAILIGSWLVDRPTGNPVSGHFIATWGIIALGVWIAFGFAFSFGSGILPAIGGGLIAAAVAWAGFAWFPGILYVVVGLAVAAMAVVAMIYLFQRERIDTGGVEIRGDEFEYRQLDALYFAYRQKDESLDTVVTQYSRLQRQGDRTTRENIGFVGGLWLPIVWMIFVLWFYASPQLSRSNTWDIPPGTAKVEPGRWALGRWEAVYASGSTRIVCNVDSLVDGKQAFGTMELAGQAPVAAHGTVSSYHDSIPDKLFFNVVDAGLQKKSLEAQYDRQKDEFTGYYYDRRGIMHQLVFKRVPYSKPAVAEADKAN